MCILFVYTLLKVVSYYDLSVLSMSLMGFQTNLDGGLGELYPVFFWILGFFLTLQSPLPGRQFSRMIDTAASPYPCS